MFILENGSCKGEIVSERVLVLGAGVYQVPLIKAAKQRGYETLVASIPGAYPGFELCDKAIYADTRDEETLLKVARNEQISAVVTACTDVSVPALGRICDEMNLVGVSHSSAVLASDKTAMKQAFAAHGVSTAPFRVLSIGASGQECEEAAEQIGYPAIFKAVDSSGSRGIVKVESPSDIARAMSEVRSVTKADCFLIEKFLVGTEFGMQGFVQDGVAEITMLHGDYLFHGDADVPMGHYVPYGSSKFAEAAREEATKAMRALGIVNGAANIDAILCDNKIFIIEIGARAGATCLPELVSLRYGINYYDLILSNALGQHVDIPKENDSCVAAMILCPAKEGVVDSIERIPEIDDCVRFCSIDCRPGDAIHKFKVGPDRIGQIVCCAASLDEAEEKLFDAIDGVKIRLHDGSYMTWAEPDKN